MSISLKNAERALKMVGVVPGLPIRQDDLEQRIAQAMRLAKFMDNLERPLPDGLDLPAIKGPFGRS